jgi:hypothetical protein
LYPEPPVNIGYRGQRGKHVFILSFTALTHYVSRHDTSRCGTGNI